MRYGQCLNHYLKKKRQVYVKKSKKQLKELFSKSDWDYDTYGHGA